MPPLTCLGKTQARVLSVVILGPGPHPESHTWNDETRFRARAPLSGRPFLGKRPALTHPELFKDTAPTTSHGQTSCKFDAPKSTKSKTAIAPGSVMFSDVPLAL